MAYSTGWTDSSACATCHQLTWPGASSPLYDTYGEWERSAHARSGIGCTDCHGASNANGTHDLNIPFERALTVDLQLSSPAMTRGSQEPLTGNLTVLNTGAGHAVPTGSPWSRVQLRVQLVHSLSLIHI